MKNLILLIGGLFLILNIATKFIINDYHLFNFITTSIVIIFTTAIINYTNQYISSNTYKISLFFIYSFLGIVNVVLSIFSIPMFMYNLLLLIAIFVMVLELIIFAVVKYMCKHV